VGTLAGIPEQTLTERRPVLTPKTILLLALAGGLVAGCGSSRPAGRVSTPPTPARAAPRILRVLVVDGDLGRGVRGAAVRIGGTTVESDRRGYARFLLSRRVAAVVRVTRRGYKPVSTFRAFRHKRRIIVRLYQPNLQWPLFAATPERTAAQTHIQVRPPFRFAWARPMGGLIEYPAVVSDGVAYIGNAHATVRAISMYSGRIVWRRRLPHVTLASSPAVYDDELVVHGMDGHVWVLDRKHGRLLWRFYVGAPIESSPLVRDGVDYFGSWNGRVYALDLRRRRLHWTYPSGYKITASVAFAGGTLYVGNYGGQLLALHAGSGRRRFAASVNGRIYGAAAVAGGRVFVPSSDGNSLTAFSVTGRELWSVHTGSYVYSSPAVWAGRVMFGSYNGIFYCLSARSGAVLWEVGLGGPISGGVVAIDGVAYAGSFSHRIVGVDVRTGRVVFRFRHGDYVPVSGDGYRLLFHGYSILFAAEPRHRRR
jgi:outer membrane protein assembly factor BamB